LQASTDGQTWSDIDTRTNNTFDARCLSKKFDITNGSLYSHFRLQITAANSNEVRIAEWQIHGRYIDSNDLTALPGGTLTVQWTGKNEANAPANLTDKNKDGKYYNVGRKFFWAVFETAEPVKLTAYSLMSANDWQTRDPKSWTLYGSNDNTTWTAIDRRENQSFLYRQTTLYYPVTTNSEYRYFKLDIEENIGEKEVQLAEWQLFSREDPGAGIASPATKRALNIYPHPASDFVLLELPEASLVSIKSLNGLTVYREKVQPGKQAIPLQNCLPGVYLLTAESDKGLKTRLLIKK
jgi:hypothetical protein